MKYCYIAGKITGLPIEVYTKLFEEAKKEVITLGYEPLSPIELPHEHDKSWESYMKESMQAMLNCKAIYLIENWIDSEGAKIEMKVAKIFSYEIFFQNSSRKHLLNVKDFELEADGELRKANAVKKKSDKMEDLLIEIEQCLSAENEIDYYVEKIKNLLYGDQQKT